MVQQKESENLLQLSTSSFKLFLQNGAYSRRVQIEKLYFTKHDQYGFQSQDVETYDWNTVKSHYRKAQSPGLESSHAVNKLSNYSSLRKTNKQTKWNHLTKSNIIIKPYFVLVSIISYGHTLHTTNKQDEILVVSVQCFDS